MEMHLQFLRPHSFSTKSTEQTKRRFHFEAEDVIWSPLVLIWWISCPEAQAPSETHFLKYKYKRL